MDKQSELKPDVQLTCHKKENEKKIYFIDSKKSIKP